MSLMGVAIVTYNSAAEILPCLESLLASEDAHKLRVVVVDNASSDDTRAVIENWSDGRVELTVPKNRLSSPVTMIGASQNSGFASGVNIALTTLLRDPEIDRFWILNPDTIVPPHSAKELMRAPASFALMGCRIRYTTPGNPIQIDAGQIDPKTGVTRNLNIGRDAETTPPPEDSEIHFISGASMVASRSFIAEAGLMPEHYFLYYEEVDWALRRGKRPLVFCETAEVYHQAGASIGSPTLDRGASLTSLYHKHRSRILFLSRWFPRSLVYGLGYGFAKAMQLALTQGWRSGAAVLAGQFGLQNPFNGHPKPAPTDLQPTIPASSDNRF